MFKTSRFLLLVITLIIAAHSYAESVNVFFSPHADLNSKLAEYIDNSAQSVKGCFYSLSSEKVVRSLRKARLRGVEVQIVMDESRVFEEDSFYPQLKNIGIAKKDEITKGLMHHKFFVIDEKLVWTGSYNPGSHAIYTNNDALIIESEELAGIYLREFKKLWEARTAAEDKKYGNKVKIGKELQIEVYFSPEEGAAILRRLIEVLENAETGICFAQFTVTHPDIAKVLIEKANKGIDVKGIMEYDQIGAYSQYPAFKLSGINVKQDKNYFFPFHHKFFIIDGKMVVTGSLNPTKAGLNLNRENILFIQSPEIAQEYVKYFENLR